MRSHLTSIAAMAAVVVSAAGCGSADAPETPAACLAPAGTYLTALEGAPEAVTLPGATRISECLVDEQPPGPLAEVGGSVVGAASDLNAQAREDPGGDATLRLGYLVGAVRKAAESTGGIHEDLTLRLDSAARYLPGGGTLPLSFERAFGTGYAAGQANG